MKPGKFLFIATLFGAATYLVVKWGVSAGWFSQPTFLLGLVIINVLVTFAIYRWLFKLQNPQLFVNGYLLSIAVKLIFYSGLLLAIRIISPQALQANAVLVLACYIIFTILEVVVLFLKVGR
jgi:hypothetical protein